MILGTENRLVLLLLQKKLCIWGLLWHHSLTSSHFFLQAKQLQLFQSFLLNLVLSLITSCIFIFFALSWNIVTKCRYLHAMRTHQCWTETWFCAFWRLYFSLNISVPHLWVFFIQTNFIVDLIGFWSGCSLHPPLSSLKRCNSTSCSLVQIISSWNHSRSQNGCRQPPQIRQNLLHSFCSLPLQIYSFMLI